ncbi:hypothetical protein IJI94_00060 [Candidatus Saccharibacteria bacterium]|nr:hypothetical protein [Candidatus Saccharibacteria bacterium]
MKKNGKKKRASIKGDLIIFLCLIFILTGMTIGFAHFSVLIQTQGVVTVKPEGIVHFTQLDLISYTNVDASYQPSYTDTDLDFNLHFIEDDPSEPYSATYQITVQNDTFYNQTFLGVSYSPSIVDGEGTSIPSSSFSYTLNGLSEGDMIAAGSSVTFTITMTLTASSGDYVVDGEATVTTETSEVVGHLSASLVGETTKDLTGNTVRTATPFTVSVMNTHNTAQTFDLLVGNTDHYKLTDANGNNISSFTISANDPGTTYTFYVERLSGAVFGSNSETTSITLLSTNNERVGAGYITLEVDQTPYTDTTAPKIWNVNLTMVRTTEGQAVVTWRGKDDVAVDYYTVEIYNSSNTRVGDPHNTQGDETSMTISSLSTGTYYAKVYGVDTAGNTATATEISRCSTDLGYCSKSSDVPMQWRFNVTYSLDNLSSSGASTALIDSTYTTTLSVSGGLTRRLPDSITVTMGGNTLSAGTGYTYSSSSGEVRIPNVSGAITITAAASGGCLVEGTMVKMADGTEKPIEQVGYHDYLLVWSYAEGKAVARQPIWIEKEATAAAYQVAEFSDGTSIKTVAGHGMFNVDLNRFVNVANEHEFHAGMHVYKIGEDQNLESVEITNIYTVQETVKYYHVVSTEFYNIFANGFLTTDDEVLLSNLYGFDDVVKWPASRNEIVKDKNNLYDYIDFDFMPRWMFDGMRVEEGRYLNNIGILPKDIFIKYLKDNQLNPDLYLPRE